MVFFSKGELIMTQFFANGQLIMTQLFCNDQRIMTMLLAFVSAEYDIMFWKWSPFWSQRCCILQRSADKWQHCVLRSVKAECRLPICWAVFGISWPCFLARNWGLELITVFFAMEADLDTVFWQWLADHDLLLAFVSAEYDHMFRQWSPFWSRECRKLQRSADKWQHCVLRSVNYDNVVYESRLVVKMLCSAKYKIQVFDLFLPVYRVLQRWR